MVLLADRIPVPIDPGMRNMPHDPDALHIYRGYAIVGVPDGWDVMDPTRPDDAEELGWANDMEQAMSIVDEIVDEEIADRLLCG
jgi:hypothetical protein